LSVNGWLKQIRTCPLPGVLLASETGLQHVVAFDAQQAVEKCLKSILVRHQIFFPKTHDLARLLALVAVPEPAVAVDLQPATVLTPFGAELGYPGDTPEMLPGESAHALELARLARDTVSDVLRSYLGSTSEA
jgi:HEPN domain-containing protein